MNSVSTVEKLYMFQPKLYTLETHIASLGKDEKGKSFLRLAQTIFHPQGGGQPCDFGMIRTLDARQVEVCGVQKEINPEELDKNNFEIRHYYTPENTQLAVGEQVTLTINPERREQNARLHSAGHLIAAVVERMFPKDWKAISGHHYPKEARVEFSPQSQQASKESVQAVLAEALQKEIAANLPVQIVKEGTGRKIQIGDYETVPCGGTHVEKLSEIGKIQINDIRIKSSNLRVSYDVAK